jgi:hypothetical protein
MTLHEKLVAAGCEIGNHESDLHVKVSEEAIITIVEHALFCDSTMKMPAKFVSNIDGSLWYDIPFAYDPFFNKPAKATSKPIARRVPYSIFDETLDDNDESDSEYDLLH